MRRSLFLVVTACFAVATLSAQPKFLWTKLGLGPTFDEARALAISPQGDLRFAAVFSDSVDLDGTITQAFGNYDILLGRMAKTGQLLMVDAHGGLDFEDVRSVAVDNQGSTYLVGSFTYSAFIGEDVFADGEASADLFIAKWSRLGIFEWVKAFGGKTYDESAPFVACDSVGNVYLAGAYGGSNVSFGTQKFTAAGKGDMLLVKLNGATGDVIWAKNGGGIGNDEALGVSVTRTGDAIYVAGTFEGVGNWSGDRLESVNGKPDFFLASYDASGALKWLKRAGHPEVDRYIAVGSDADGNMLVTGAINATTTFDGQVITANGENRSDLLVARITKAGNVTLLQRYGDIFTEIGHAITSDAKNNIYVAGAFDSVFTEDGNTFLGQGGLDAFAMKIRPDGTFDWFRPVGGPYDDEMRGIVIDKQNIPYVVGNFDTRLIIDDESQEGERYTDFFVGSIECGPNTALRPGVTEISICQGGDSAIVAPAGYPTYQWHVNGSSVADPTRNRYDLSTLPVGQHKIKVRITDQNDCSLFSKEVTVTVTEGMAKPSISQSGTTLTCNITDAADYVWYREGKRIMGQSTNSIIAQGNGTYRVRVTDSTGCTRWSDPIVIGTTSVDEGDVDLSNIRVYPNPTRDNITVDGLSDGSSLLVTDVLGRTIAQYDNVSGSYTIELNDQPHGLYTLVIRSAKRELTRLVVKR